MDKNKDVVDGDWTEVNSEPSDEQNTQQENAEPEQKFDPEWAEKSKEEIKAGFKQISDAIAYAVKVGKNDPKIKQFGDEVKSTLNKIGDDISNLFN